MSDNATHQRASRWCKFGIVPGETTHVHVSVRRKLRLWLVLLTAIALLALIRSGIGLHKQFEVSRNGVRTYGWVTGKGGENSGIVYYAYHANEQTYGGQYRLSSFDSDFDLTNTGDTVNVIYSSAKPYISIVGDDPQGGLEESEAIFMLWFVAVLTAAWLTAVFRRKSQPQRLA